MKKPMQNILSVAGSDGLSRLLGFATNAYLARVLGTSAFGVMSIGFSVLGYATMLSSPGLNVMGTRDVAAGKERVEDFVSTINSLRFILALLCACATAVISFVVIQPLSAAATVVFFALSAAPLALSLDWYFQGKEDLFPVSASRVLIAFAYLLLVLALVRSSLDVAWTSVAFLVANCIATIWLIARFHKQGNVVSFRLQLKEWRVLLSRSLPLGISALLTQTIMNLPVLIVGALVSLHDAGLFNAALKLIFAAMLIDRVFYAMFFPVISRQRATNMETFRQTASLALKIILAVAIPIVVGGGFFATDILTLVYGVSFADGAISFQILLLYFLFSVVNTILMGVMIAENRERDYLRMLALATLVLVLLCVVLAYSVGINGAAASVAVGECLMMVFLFSTEGKYAFTSIMKLILPSIIAGAAMLGALLLVPTFPMFVMIPIGVFAFAIVFVAVKGISRTEIIFLRERFV